MAAHVKPGIYRGVVKNFHPPNNTLSVLIKENGAEMSCIWAASILSGMLGFKTSFHPPVKTEVVVWVPTKSSFGYVIGTVPNITTDPGMQQRYVADDPAFDYTRLQTFHKNNSAGNQAFVGHKPAVDLAEGEINVENYMGVGLTLLRHLSSIQAGDLARVECHLMDDMVRIVSDTFKHYTSFGDYKISNDGGKLNVIWNGASFDFETWGNRKATDPKAPTPSRTDVGDNLLDSKGADDGRWRFTQYLGWLGNFLHMFVSDPVSSLGKIAENQFRSGKAHLHVNDDGSVLLQSVADIVLEKVVAIPVPVPIRAEDDPKGDRSDGQTQRPEVLSTWQPSDQTSLFEMAFQLREYARWLNNTYALGRFHQLTRDYQVPSEAQTPVPDINSAMEDKQKQNPSAVNWQLKYCTIRIYRDGSIQTVDAYGNVITTTAIGIQVSSPKDVLIQAGGSVNIVAGRDINLLAQKNVNLDAVTGALRLRAKSAIMFFCTAGNLIYEVASGMVHRFIGTITANNTVSIQTSGEIDTVNTVLAQTVTADTISAGSVTGTAVNAVKVFQTDPPGDGNGTWDSSTTPVPAPDIQVVEVDAQFQYQSDYGVDRLYRTMTQQMWTNAEIADQNTTWAFADNAVPGRGAPWPGAAQELTTTAGDKLNTPSSNTIFSAKPKPLTTQPPTMKTAL